MPEKKTLQRARADKKAGKSASTQAGEFIREQIHHIRQGRHGARSAKQAIAIGLSEARRSGVELAPPSGAKTSPKTIAQAQRDYARGHGAARRSPGERSPAARRSAQTKGSRARAAVAKRAARS